ncbi:MAG TPA: hypothetical protein VM123_08245 [archaeon]|nr:hypothetical protein [archaeon]
MRPTPLKRGLSCDTGIVYRKVKAESAVKRSGSGPGILFAIATSGGNHYPSIESKKDARPALQGARGNPYLPDKAYISSLLVYAIVQLECFFP